MTIVQKSVVCAASLLGVCFVVLFFDSQYYDGGCKGSPCEPFAVLGFSTTTVVMTLLLVGIALIVTALVAQSKQTGDWW